MKHFMFIVFICGQLVLLVTGLTIASFNIQSLSSKKLSKTVRDIEVGSYLTGIIQRYDVILIQEIRDDRVIGELIRHMGTGYRSEISVPLGSTSYKERYAFLIRERSGATIEATHQYEGPGYERPPFSVLIKSTTTAVEQFVLIGLHSKPDGSSTRKTVNELNNLDSLRNYLVGRWGTENILIMGDLNLDEPYVTPRDELYLGHPRYKWWIENDQKTNLAKSKTYDRFISTGAEFERAVQHRSARVFPFDAYYRLTNDEAKKLSDHYPIEITLSPKSIVPKKNGSFVRKVSKASKKRRRYM